MDFTSFSPEETATMRNFLLQQRSVYAEAAKMAAKFDDTTDPEYMNYVDQMQGVNNSFTNLASQLKSYKQGKVEYAKTMQEGLYSNGNDDDRSLEAAIIYGFIDEDKDGRSDKRLDAPFQIQNGGNIAFNVGGQEITYNGMEEPFLKDTKFLNSLNATSEKAYNSGLRGNANNPYSKKAYDQQLNDTLQNEDALRSIIFDFNAEASMEDIGKKLDNGVITLNEARDDVKARLLKAREDAYIKGKTEYDIKKAEQEELSGNGAYPTGTEYFADPKISTGLASVQNKLTDMEYAESPAQPFFVYKQGPNGDVRMTGSKTPRYYIYVDVETGIRYINKNKEMAELGKLEETNQAFDRNSTELLEAFGIQ
jgi:hypothetical protein